MKYSKKDYDCIASVVVYDTPISILKECIDSFLNTKLRVKIYIIDVSPEGYTLEPNENIYYYHSKENLGYGKGNNLAIQLAEDSKYFLVLNPDVFIVEDALEKLIQFMDRNESIGISIPQVFSLDGSRQFLNKRNPTLLALFIRRFFPQSLHFLFKNILEDYEMRDLYQEENYEVPFISGAFMLFRKKALLEVKGFDPRYFLYFEDADICRMVQKLGYQTIYYSKAKIIHVWSRGAHKKINLTFVFISSMIKYFNKWGWKIF